MSVRGETPGLPAVEGLVGLTSAEAAERLARYGPNLIPERHPHLVRALLAKFWAPVPWMLEITVALELALDRRLEAVVIAVLLAFNAVVGFVQERRARNAVALLRRRLAVQARVLRDGRWTLLPAQELAPGDVVHLRMGDIAPADVSVATGQILVDQSTLTGESIPVEVSAKQTAYAGAIIKRGEATGEVAATGAQTLFGKTAELMRAAESRSHLQAVILTIVKYLMALDALAIAAVVAYSLAVGLPLKEVVPFVLILLLASIPVALPATFTLATALGALELAGHGVLVTRLSAIEEAAGMDVLCTDKTGTITKNELSVAAITAYAPYTEDQALRLAAIACDEATQDPIDLAVLRAAHGRGLTIEAVRRTQFIPFDPANKRSEAVFMEGETETRVMKGFPQTIRDIVAGENVAFEDDVSKLAEQGRRILAVAAGPAGKLQIAGLVALEDPPREDSRALVQALNDLGVRVAMVTGDGLETALSVARQVGVGGQACSRELLRQGLSPAVLDSDVFAGVLPEDKFHLVKALQNAGHTVGMTGDGVNDAPALKQAEVGIAVASAADVAKAAASLVLTSPGLGDIVAAIETSRRIYQRMLTYTLNKIIKTCELALFLSLGLIFTGTFVTTPLLVLLLFFTNDFVTMSIATDRVSFGRAPDQWQIRHLMMAALVLAAFMLLLSFAIFFWGRDWLQLPLPQLQTLVFTLLVFSGQGTVYLVRERRHFWNSRPSAWLLCSSLVDVAVVALLATQGVLMAPVPLALVAATFGVTFCFLVLLDFLKVQLFQLGGT